MRLPVHEVTAHVTAYSLLETFVWSIFVSSAMRAIHVYVCSKPIWLHFPLQFCYPRLHHAWENAAMNALTVWLHSQVHVVCNDIKTVFIPFTACFHFHSHRQDYRVSCVATHPFQECIATGNEHGQIFLWYVCMYVCMYVYILYVQHLYTQVLYRWYWEYVEIWCIVYAYYIHMTCVYNYVVWSVVLHLHLCLLRCRPVCQVPVCHLFLHSNTWSFVCVPMKASSQYFTLHLGGLSSLTLNSVWAYV